MAPNAEKNENSEKTQQDSNEQTTKDKLLARRRNVLSSANVLFYESQKEELLIERAEGQYLIDEKGNKYLDLINNVAHIGHCHPKVTDAVTKQMNLQYTNSRYLNQRIIEYSEHLLSYFPAELDTVLFCNSGSEATDLALRLSSYFTGRSDYICLTGAYHGHVQSALEVSPYKWKGGLVRQPDNVHVAEAPDTFRGSFTGENAAKKYADQVGDILAQKPEKVAAFIAESLMSCAGQIMPPSGYFKEVYDHCRKNGALCIADEVQVGFGRVGKKMWAFELQDVIPDLVTIGKPIGNGFPIAAVVTRREIAEAYWKSGSQYFNTFGGNAVAAAAANAVLTVIEDEKLQENAEKVGNYILEGLHKLKKEFPVMSDVRGHGLFVGVELLDENSKPNETLAYHIRNELLKKHRIVISVDGPDENVLKMKPPMCLSEENATEVLAAIKNVLEERRIATKIAK